MNIKMNYKTEEEKEQGEKEIKKNIQVTKSNEKRERRKEL